MAGSATRLVLGTVDEARSHPCDGALKSVQRVSSQLEVLEGAANGTSARVVCQASIAPEMPKFNLDWPVPFSTVLCRGAFAVLSVGEP